MDTVSIIFAVVSAAAGGAASWFAAKAHFGRDADTLRAQADRVEKERQIVTKQWQQARREVDQLQKDIMARGVARPAAASPARDAAAEKRERAAAAESALAAVRSDNKLSALPSHGFADTQPMASLERV